MLQSKLNEMHIGSHLTEDGVYGKKTMQAWSTFLTDLEHGTVPTLRWTDLLQTERTGIRIGSTPKAAEKGLKNAFLIGENRYIRLILPITAEGHSFVASREQ